MAENGAHFSGEGHLIEAVIFGDPNKTVIPVICDSDGRLFVVLGTGNSVIGTVKITDTNGDTVIAKNGALNVNIDDGETFEYVAGELTSAGSIITTGTCRGIRVFANGVNSSFAISGGNVIQVRSNQIFYHIPQGELVDPTIDWVSGSLDVWLEIDAAIVPPGTGDLGLSLGVAHLGL